MNYQQLDKQLEQSNREKDQFQKDIIELKKLMEQRESVSKQKKKTCFKFFFVVDFNQELQDRISALTNERNDYQIATVTTTERIKEIENAKQVNIYIHTWWKV